MYTCGLCSKFIKVNGGECKVTGEKVNAKTTGGDLCPIKDAINAKKVFKCRGCGIECVWTKTNNDKSMIVEAESWHGEENYVNGVHLVHWARCPKAKKFRKKDF